MTRTCLEHLHKHDVEHSEIIVIDNGSTDATCTELDSLGKKLFGERCICIRNANNEGFAKACNQGAQQASADYLFFLNNDTQVTAHWFNPLMEALSASEQIGAVAPLLLYPDSARVQHCGIAFSPTLHPEHIYTNFPADHAAIRTPRTLQAISGAAILLRKETFFQCGMFHEGYQNGYEDLELCHRIREKGLSLCVVPESSIFHAEARTEGRYEHAKENAALFATRCSGAFRPDLHTHALQNNFAIGLTPWLAVHLTLMPDYEAALTKHHLESFDMASCWEALQQEPLWQGGYQLMCSVLEDAELYAESAGLRLLQTSFFPSVPHYRQLADVAERAGNSDLAERAQKKIEEITSALEDPIPLILEARKLTEWGQKAGDPVVESLYAGWLTDLGLSLTNEQC